MSGRWRSAAALGASTALTLAASAALAPGRALAYYGQGATIMSADLQTDEEGDSPSTFGAIAAGGSYVAMQTQASNFFAADDPDPPGECRIGGVFRRGVDDGTLEKVADGDTYVSDAANGFACPSSSLVFQGAENPSISADGEYVVFATNEQLTPQPTNGASEVYERDMNVAIPTCDLTQPTCTPNPYTLVSANSDGTPAQFQAPSPSQPGANPGAALWPGTAVSADGQTVLFRTSVASNLPGDAATPTTPAMQLFVRDLSAGTTTLVTTQTIGGAQPAGGAFGPSSLSADGTTVAWTGDNATEQTPFLAGETPTDTEPYYLWRQLSGPLTSAGTRRVTGIADLDDPGCDHATAFVSTDETATGPCYGPLTLQESQLSGLALLPPALSADGYTVAFITAAGPRPDPNKPGVPDLWVTSMAPGVSRKAGTRELTSAGDPSDPLASSPVLGVAISPDGTQIALTSQRTKWVLASPVPSSGFRGLADDTDVDLVNLSADTIERVTVGYDGSDTDGNTVGAPTLSEDGGRVAFASSADNLFFGDANSVADVFVAQRQSLPQAMAPPPPPAQQANSVTQFPDLPALPTISIASHERLRDGSERLVVHVPTAGTLKATASAHEAAPAARKRRGRKPKPPPLRTLAAATAVAHGAGFITVTLTPKAPFAALVRRGRSFSARVSLTFTEHGGARLVTAITVTFARAKGGVGAKKTAKRRK